MKYVDVSFKKILAISLIAGAIAVGVFATATVWEKQAGPSFSLSNVSYSISDFFMTTWYRIELNSGSLAAFIGLSGSTQFSAAGANTPAQTIPVLIYHGLLPTSNTAEVTTIDNFKSQMFALKAAGWQTVSVEDFTAAMQGTKILPPKSFLLTFDDGRQDAYYNGTPILQALGYQAVMYVITGHSLAPGASASSYYLTKDQLRQMLSSGAWELQAHSNIGHIQYPIDAAGTVGDFYGNELWVPPQEPGESDYSYEGRIYTVLTDYFRSGTKYDLATGRRETLPEYQSRIVTDLTNSKVALQTNLNVNSISFAYPYNDFAQDLKTDSANATPGLIGFVNKIFQVSFYQWYPSLGFSQNYVKVDGQLLKRIEPKPTWTPDHLLAILNAGQPKSLPYTMATGNDDNWTNAWGNVTSTNGTVVLSASSTTTGAYTILDGTRLWGDYEYEATFNWQNAQSLSIYGHYQADPEKVSYIACNFGNGVVQLEDHEGGTVTVLAHQVYSAIGPGNGQKAGIQFTGNYVGCLWNGGTITYAHIPPSTGGIGFEIWNPEHGTAAATITGATVR